MAETIIYTDSNGDTINVGDDVTFRLGKNTPKVEITSLFMKGSKQKVELTNPVTSKTMVRNASSVTLV